MFGGQVESTSVPLTMLHSKGTATIGQGMKLLKVTNALAYYIAWRTHKCTRRIRNTSFSSKLTNGSFKVERLYRPNVMLHSSLLGPSVSRDPRLVLLVVHQ